MYLSRESGWYATDTGEVYVAANKRYADNDPAIKAIPGIFDKISDDAAPGAVKAAVTKAKAAAAAARPAPAAAKGGSDG